MLTFEKWVENCVHQLVTLMHYFPVTFKKNRKEKCERKRENPSVNVKKLMEVKAHFAVVQEVLWKSTCFWATQLGTSLWFHHQLMLLDPNKHIRILKRNTGEVKKNKKTNKLCYMALKHTVVLWRKMKDDKPFFTPNRKGLLFCFKAKLSSSGLQNKKKNIL